MEQSFLKIGVALLCMSLLPGCASAQTEITSGGYSFGNGAGNYSDTFFCYRTGERQTSVLNYESMKTASLCNKPNCSHTGDGCIVKRLDGNIPVFGDKCAYYFVDEEPVIEQNQQGLADLTLHSALYRYDFGSDTEKMLLQIDGACVGNNCKGLMLDQDELYFVENKLGRSYDEAGALFGYHLHGGDLSLHSVNLSDMKVKDLCELYDVHALEQYYPQAPYSGSVTMQGKYDNKIYFNVVFALDETGAEPGYYVTYYDLTDGSYHGTPDDYAKIESGKVMFLSADYLVILRKEGEVEVYRNGSMEPVILEDEYYFTFISDIFIDSDVLYCFDKAFDLNTKKVHNPKALTDEMQVIARYGDSFILSKRGMLGEFKKISAEKLLK